MNTDRDLEIEVPVDMVKAMQALTLKAKIERRTEWLIRMWLGIKVMQLAGLLIGTKIEIEVVETDAAADQS